MSNLPRGGSLPPRRNRESAFPDVTLAPEDYDLWLDPGVRDVERLQLLLRRYPAEEMMACPVSTRVNYAAKNSPECIEPFPGQRLTAD